MIPRKRVTKAARRSLTAHFGGVTRQNPPYFGGVLFQREVEDGEV